MCGSWVLIGNDSQAEIRRDTLDPVRIFHKVAPQLNQKRTPFVDGTSSVPLLEIASFIAIAKALKADSARW